MQKNNAHIIHHFYELLLEMNFRSSEDREPSSVEMEDPFIRKHLQHIRLKLAKTRVELKKSTYLSLLEYIDKLRKIGSEELNSLLTPNQAAQLQPLFSKFDSLTENDKQSIAEDEELLQLISALKEKLDDGLDNG